MGVNLMVDIGGIRLHENPEHTGWGVLRGGIGEGWWDSPDSRDEDDPLPGADGSFEQPEPIVEARRVTLRGAHVASSPEWSVTQTRSRLAALVKSADLGFRVWEAGRWLALRRARIRGRVKVTEARPNVAVFELTVYSADPRKYGPMRRVEMDAAVEPSGGLRFPMVDGAVSFGTTGGVLFPGVFALRNPGTADFVPDRFTVIGPVDGFTITSESNVIEYAGAVPVGQQLVITPYAGGRATLGGADVSHNLLQADWVAVQPGETRGYLFTPDEPGAGARLIVDYPEGAWW